MPESIRRDECLRLLGTAELARVVLSVKCLPVALPARIVSVTRRGVLLATNERAVLDAATHHDVVGLQSDGLDPDGLTWSVMVSGLASLAPHHEGTHPPVRTPPERSATLIYVPLTVVAGQRG